MAATIEDIIPLLTLVPDEGEGTKVCTKCSGAFPLGRFRPIKRGRFGRHSICRSCENVARTKRRVEARKGQQRPKTFPKTEFRRVAGHGRGGWIDNVKCASCGGNLYFEDDTHDAVCLLCSQAHPEIDCGCPVGWPGIEEE